MDSAIIISPEKIGWLIWIIWALIGVVAALFAQRMMPNSGMRTFNIIIAVVAAVIGGFLSIQYVGGTPLILLGVSILAAVFTAGIMLWIVAALTAHFTPKE